MYKIFYCEVLVYCILGEGISLDIDGFIFCKYEDIFCVVKDIEWFLLV